jgi:UDP-N-acetylmuramoyl-tripeptide--D-alanyl-D-alanine ligase
MKMKLTEIAAYLGAKCLDTNLDIEAISIDTRTIPRDALFVCIIGKNFDGHEFVMEAQQKGAVAAIVNRDFNSQSLPATFPIISVQDTRWALGQLAKLHRENFNIPIVAVTGSCGKTTTKTMIAQILSECGQVLCTEGSLNNDIGVPLTLLRLKEQHQFAVVELGANHPGEIAALTKLVQPTVTVITNAGLSHLEGFIDIEGVAKAKGEIFQGLGEDGSAVINKDDESADYWRGLIGKRKHLSFGNATGADISIRDVRYAEDGCPSFILKAPQGEMAVCLKVMGEHNIANAMAAAAVACVLAAPLTAIKQGLEMTMSGAKRLVKRNGQCGSQIIDDTYNANPSSLRAVLKVLARSGGEKILVLGDMVELGNNALEHHAMVGKEARLMGIEQLYACGRLSQAAVAAFGEGGHFFQTQAELVNRLRTILHPGMTILVKGSRASRMENVVNALVQE